MARYFTLRLYFHLPLITRVVIATLAGPGVQVFWVFTATFTLVEPTQLG